MTEEVAAEHVAVSWGEFLTEATDRLERAGVVTAAVDARRIVEEAAGIEAGDFHRSIDGPASWRAVVRFDEMVARRARGEPLQYVLGRWGFRSLDLHVDRRVLIPRPETEVVAGLAIAEVARRATGGRKILVADLGTGSGAIALAVAAEMPGTRVYATDLSEDALAVARANLAGLGRAATRVSVHRGSWYAALPASVQDRLDVVVANPPYIADGEALPSEVADWEPVGALRAGPRGTEDAETLIDEGEAWLRPDGVLVVEIAPHQAAAMADRARARGYAVTVHLDLAGRERALVARR